MRHGHHGRPRRPHRQPAIACAAACDDCAHEIGNPEASENGIRMALIHIDHVPELEALGWIVTPGEDGIPDVTCVHYHLKHWEGGHVGCGCELDGATGD